jgi:hypothetical protein
LAVAIIIKPFRSPFGLTGKKRGVNINSDGRLSRLSRLSQGQSPRFDAKRDVLKIQSVEFALKNALMERRSRSVISTGKASLKKNPYAPPVTSDTSASQPAKPLISTF